MGPFQTTMLLFVLVVVLLISNIVLLRHFRDAKEMIERYDALVEQYGGLEMVLAKLTGTQVMALMASSTLGLSALTGCESEPQRSREVRSGTPIVYDRSASYLGDTESLADLNAAAASMLLQLNGIDVAEDDLYLTMCLASSADEVAEAINQFVPTDRVCVPLDGTNLLYLPGPSIVWIDEKPVVFVYADEARVQAWEIENIGLEEPTKYGFSDFERKYELSGRKAVCLMKRGYEPIT